MEISETLPGLNAVNMAMIIGDNLRGIPGAIVAVIGMLLPGSIVVMVAGDSVSVESRLIPTSSDSWCGIAAAAVGLLTTVTLQIGRQPIRQAARHRDHRHDVLRGQLSSKCSLPSCCSSLGPISVWLYRPQHFETARQPDEHLPFHRGERHHLFRH